MSLKPEPKSNARSDDDLDPNLAVPDKPVPRAPDTVQRIERERNPVKRLWALLGPGLTSGASNNDPSAIATYAQAGAMFGFLPLWFAILVLPFMSTAVYLSGKLAMLNGSGLAGILRKHFPRWLLYGILGALIIANTIAVGADLGAIVAGIGLVFPVLTGPWMLAAVTVFVVAMQIVIPYRIIANIFKWLTFAFFAFVIAGILARPDWREVLRHTAVPAVRFDSEYLSMLVAMLGTSLSPYLYFWQASQRVEEQVYMGRYRLWQRRGASDAELRYAAWDVNAGMLLACVVVYFIILSTAATLHQAGVTEIATAADAAQALMPLAGSFAGILFAIGFVGAGILAIPVLSAGPAYAFCEAFDWKYGYDQSFKNAPQFYGAIALTTLAGMSLNFLGIPPIRMLIIAAMVNGILTPVLLLVIMLASNNAAIVRDKKNQWYVNLFGWLACITSTLGVLAWGVMKLSS